MSINVIVPFRYVNGKKKNARTVVKEVQHEYLGGRIGTTNGDTFQVIPAKPGTFTEIRGRREQIHYLAVS